MSPFTLYFPPLSCKNGVPYGTSQTPFAPPWMGITEMPSSRRKLLRNRYRSLYGESLQKRFLTQSQKEAVSMITDAFLAKQRCHQLIGFRAQPLVVGLSGSGKTHAIFEAGRLLEKPVLALSVGTWMVQGSHADHPTLSLVRDKMREGTGCLLLLDEIDKLSARLTHDDGWFALIMTEVFMLLDQSDHLCHAAGWTEQDLAVLRSKSMVVGAGAWQIPLLSANQRIGFGNADNVPAQRAIEATRVIPDEVLFRFSPEMAVVTPPSVIDLARGLQVLRGNLGLDRLPVVQAVRTAKSLRESGRGMRALEAYAMKLALESPYCKPLPVTTEQKAIAAPSGPSMNPTCQAYLFQDGVSGADELARCLYELGLETSPDRLDWPTLAEAKRIIGGFRRLLLPSVARSELECLDQSVQKIRKWLLSRPKPRNSARVRTLMAAAMAAVARLSALLEIFGERGA